MLCDLVEVAGDDVGEGGDGVVGEDGAVADELALWHFETVGVGGSLDLAGGLFGLCEHSATVFFSV